MLKKILFLIIFAPTVCLLASASDQDKSKLKHRRQRPTKDQLFTVADRITTDFVESLSDFTTTYTNSWFYLCSPITDPIADIRKYIADHRPNRDEFLRYTEAQKIAWLSHLKGIIVRCSHLLISKKENDGPDSLETGKIENEVFIRTPELLKDLAKALDEHLGESSDPSYFASLLYSVKHLSYMCGFTSLFSPYEKPTLK